MASVKRILQVLSSTQRTGGVEAMIMNVYRNIDRSGFQFDFISHMHGPRDLNSEMEAMGANVFEIPFLTKIGYKQYSRLLKQILRESGPYQAVHSHLDSQGWVAAKIARDEGVPVRVCHAHLDHGFDRSLRTGVKLGLAKRLAPRYATHLGACGDAAARSVFGGRAVETGRVEIINNGIDARQYSNGAGVRDRRAFLEEIGAEGKKIVLQVARLAQVKNQMFVLSIAAHAKAENLPWVFVCAGSGPMHDEINAQIESNGLSEYVRLIGSRTDVPGLMQMSDVLILPSLMEGFPVVLVEAHAAGLPMIVSSAVTGDADLGLGIISFHSLDHGPAVWIDAISAAMKQPRLPSDVCAARIEERGFDVRTTADRLMKIYANQ